MDLLGIRRMLGVLAGEAVGGKREDGAAGPRQASVPPQSEPAPARPQAAGQEFGDLLSSLGSIEEAVDPGRSLALKQMEVDALRQHLVDLHDLGMRVGEMERRHLAENAEHERKLTALHRALIIARGKLVRGRAILRARRRALAAKLRASDEAHASMNEKLVQLKERYERRRADVDKLRQTGRELREQAKERNAELRELRKQVRSLESEQARGAKWRERVEKEVRSMLDGRANGSEAPAGSATSLAALFALRPREEARRSRPARKED